MKATHSVLALLRCGGAWLHLLLLSRHACQPLHLVTMLRHRSEHPRTSSTHAAQRRASKIYGGYDGRALVSRCASAKAKPLLSDISGGIGTSGLMDGPAALAAALLTAAVPVNGAHISPDNSNGVHGSTCPPELLDALSLTVPALAGATSSRRRTHSKYASCCRPCILTAL